jgi:NAD(P)-dependent dehydrogenase (short-subunit alcohol dehydrogenase family)
MSGRLQGKIALVTGAGGAIGGAIARRFAAEGAAVCVADINLEGAEKTVTDIQVAGGKAVACPLDVTIPAQCERAVQLATERFGGPTVLVNVAAGPTNDGTVVDLPLDAWTKEITTNLTGYFLMAKYAIPRIREAGGGAVINIASQLGQIGVPRRSAYCSSKAAIIELTRCMAIDHASENIRVNSISPGAINTPRSMWRYKTEEEAIADRGRFYLTRRPGRVDEIASGAVYLASDEASFCTGMDLLIDGGYLAFKGTTADLPA